jgi:hypothetical protein
MFTSQRIDKLQSVQNTHKSGGHMYSSGCMYFLSCTYQSMETTLIGKALHITKKQTIK